MNSILLALLLGATPYTEREVVALTLLGEARGEGAVGMWAVGCVIRTRAKEKGVSLKRACLIPKHFSCWNDGLISRKLLKSKEGRLAWAMAGRLVRGHGEDITNRANHYCRFDCFPLWADPARVVFKYGAHVFYRL